LKEEDRGKEKFKKTGRKDLKKENSRRKSQEEKNIFWPAVLREFRRGVDILVTSGPFLARNTDIFT